MTLDALIKDNYNYLKKVAYNITGNKTNAADLISETYLSMVDRKTKMPTSGEEFIKLYVAFMRNLSRWTRGNFKKQLNGKEILVDLEYTDQVDSEPCKECLITEVEIFKNSLAPHEKSLFELYYEDRRSCRVIAEELSVEFKCVVTKKSIEKMVLPIKEKLKNKKWNTLEM